MEWRLSEVEARDDGNQSARERHSAGASRPESSFVCRTVLDYKKREAPRFFQANLLIVLALGMANSITPVSV